MKLLETQFDGVSRNLVSRIILTLPTSKAVHITQYNRIYRRGDDLHTAQKLGVRRYLAIQRILVRTRNRFSR